MKAYPNFIIGSSEDYIIWADSSLLVYDDKIEKTYDEMLENASIKDQQFLNKFNNYQNT